MLFVVTFVVSHDLHVLQQMAVVVFIMRAAARGRGSVIWRFIIAHACRITIHKDVTRSVTVTIHSAGDDNQSQCLKLPRGRWWLRKYNSVSLTYAFTSSFMTHRHSANTSRAITHPHIRDFPAAAAAANK